MEMQSMEPDVKQEKTAFEIEHVPGMCAKAGNNALTTCG
jgi:hypothetical protein